MVLRLRAISIVFFFSSSSISLWLAKSLKDGNFSEHRDATSRIALQGAMMEQNKNAIINFLYIQRPLI